MLVHASLDESIGTLTLDHAEKRNPAGHDIGELPPGQDPLLYSDALERLLRAVKHFPAPVRRTWSASPAKWRARSRARHRWRRPR